jgi:hypothetical protein
LRNLIALPAVALVLGASCACLTACTSDVEPIFLELRWCVLDGSSEAGQADPGELVSTDRLDGDALLRAIELWDAADMGFVSVVAKRGVVKGVPVIRDPDPIRTQFEQTGDIADVDTFEAKQVALECHRAWRSLAPNLEGPVVVTARRFINQMGQTSATLAGTSQPEFPLQLRPGGGNQRGDDLCGEPRHLTSRDVFEIDGMEAQHVDVGWLVIAQPNQFFNIDHRSRTLAHEIGHLLFLGHGNGADDNGDGEEAGVTGPRRFDEYCDPLGTMQSEGAFFPKEDLAATGTACKSLMHPKASCAGLTALQVEQARAAAAVMPGCSGTPCKD